jgi:hypothetical protein
MAQSGHRDGAEECPLSGVKRTLNFQDAMSANKNAASAALVFEE